MPKTMIKKTRKSKKVFRVWTLKYEPFRLGPGLGFPYGTMDFAYATDLQAGSYEMEGPYPVGFGFQIYVFKNPTTAKWHAFDPTSGGLVGAGAGPGMCVVNVIEDMGGGGEDAKANTENAIAQAVLTRDKAQVIPNDKFFAMFSRNKKRVGVI